MFGLNARREKLEREVRLEIDYLRKLHGDEALAVAREKLERPTNRTNRRRILKETVRRLSPDQPLAGRGLIRRLFGR